MKDPFGKQPLPAEEPDTQRIALPSFAQTGQFLGKLSQLFMGNEDDKTESKAAFENLESLGNGTGREKVQN